MELSIIKRVVMSKKLVFISLILVIIVSGCTSTEPVNRRIADTYNKLGSMSYDMELVRTDVYDKPYTAYAVLEYNNISEPKALSGSRQVWNFSVVIQKPDKKYASVSEWGDDGITGSQLINGTWYFFYRKAGSHGDTKSICNADTFYTIPDRARGADVSVDTSDPGVCLEWVVDSIWKIPANLNNQSMFRINISQERIDGISAFKVEVESADGDVFYISEWELPYQKIVFWLDENLKLIKYRGTLGKQKKATDTDIGLSTIYTATLKNVIFNPKLDASIFMVDLSKYRRIAYIREKQA